MLDLQALHLFESLILILCEAVLPASVEVCHMLLANLNILPHLLTLDVLSKLLLEGDDLGLKEPNLLHQVLVHLVFVHFDALLREQLHFLLDEREHEDLLILVQNTIATLIEDIDELLRRDQPQHVVDVLTALVKDEADVRLVQQTLFAEICPLDGLPDLLAFTRTTNQRPRLLNESVDLVAGHVGQA